MKSIELARKSVFILVCASMGILLFSWKYTETLSVRVVYFKGNSVTSQQEEGEEVDPSQVPSLLTSLKPSETPSSQPSSDDPNTSVPSLVPSSGPSSQPSSVPSLTPPSSGSIVVSVDHDNSSTTSTSTPNPNPKPLLCDREQTRRGHWKGLQVEKPPYMSTERWESSCYGRNGSREGQLEESPFQDWEWTVDDDDRTRTKDESGCLFASFDVDRFCQLAANRTIAFLGDSITWQQFNSLNLLIGATDVSRQQQLIKTHACKESTKLIWKRDNYATKAGMDHLLRISDPDVIVFNRGAHYVDNDVLASQLNETMSRAIDWQQSCDENNDKRYCMLVWRTTAPGFPNCDAEAERVRGPIGVGNRSMAEDLILNPSNPWYMDQKIVFNWWNFADQNMLVESIIESQRKSNPQFRMSFIDFYEMAILRPDNHINYKDCLHYCLPGPPDAANAVLLHLMEVAASSQ